MVFFSALIALALVALALLLSLLVGTRLAMLLDKSGSRRSVPEALLIGYLAISTCLHFAVLIGRFHLLSLVVLLVATLWSVRAWPLLVQASRRNLIEAGSVAAVGLLVTAYVLGPSVLNATEVYRRGGLLLAHIDLFNHGGVISQLSRLGSGAGSNFFLVGFDTPFYHYGLYALPAFIAWLSGLNGTLLLLWLALPLGCLFLFVAVYTLTQTLLPQRMFAGLVIASASIVIFDPTRDLVLQTHLFDKSYLLAASPGVSYGAAVLIWAVAAVLRDRAAFWVTAIVATMFLLAFRANFVPLLWLAMALLLAVRLLEMRLSGRMQLAGLAAISFLGLLLTGLFHSLVFGAAPAIDQLYVFMQTFIEPPAWRDTAPARSRLLTTTAALSAALGPSLIVVVLAAWAVLWQQHRRGSKEAGRTAVLIASMLVAYLGVIAASWTPSNGDFTELNQRPFLPANVLVATLALCAIWKALPVAAVTALTIAALGHSSSGHGPDGRRQLGFPFDHNWHRSSYKLDVPSDLTEIARALRPSHGLAAYAFVPVVKEGFSFFPEAIVSAISEQPAFLSRPGLYRQIFQGSPAGTDLNSRIDQVEALGRCDASPAIVESRGAKLVTIVSEKAVPCLQQSGSYGRYRVYRLPQSRPSG